MGFIIEAELENKKINDTIRWKKLKEAGYSLTKLSAINIAPPYFLPRLESSYQEFYDLMIQQNNFRIGDFTFRDPYLLNVRGGNENTKVCLAQGIVHHLSSNSFIDDEIPMSKDILYYINSQKYKIGWGLSETNSENHRRIRDFNEEADVTYNTFWEMMEKIMDIWWNRENRYIDSAMD